MPQEDTSNVNNATKKYIKPPPKPDDESYKAELDEVQNKLNIVSDKINNSTTGGVEDKRTELNARLDKLRGKQAENKKNRSNTFEQLKSMNESLQKKKRDLRQSKDNVQYRSVKDIDDAIAKYERQIESGTLKIIEEKKIVANISNLKKSKKSVKQFEIQQNAIDEEQKAIDELKKTLDDNDFKKNNEEYEDVKAQLEAINKDHALDREKRNELFDEKKRLIAQKREIQDQYVKAKQEYKKHQDEENKRRQELRRKQAEERDNQHKKEFAARKREEAATPAFQLDIINCENLINYFQSLTGKSAQQSSPTVPTDQPDATSNIRQPDATSNVPEGTILTKKSDRGDDYFVGGGKKHKKSQKEKKSSKQTLAPFSIGIVQQLDSVQVKVPSNPSEIEQTIENLIKRKEYYIENQDRVTKENMEKAEAEIAAMEENGFGHHKKKYNNNEKKGKFNNNNEDAIAVTAEENNTTAEKKEETWTNKELEEMEASWSNTNEEKIEAPEASWASEEKNESSWASEEKNESSWTSEGKNEAETSWS